MGPRADLDAVEKRKILSPRRELNRRTSIDQPAANGFYIPSTNFPSPIYIIIIIIIIIIIKFSKDVNLFGSLI
jgi:hypothetical protein